jgi:hypothetical protein
MDPSGGVARLVIGVIIDHEHIGTLDDGLA